MNASAWFDVGDVQYEVEAAWCCVDRESEEVDVRPIVKVHACPEYHDYVTYYTFMREFRAWTGLDERAAQEVVDGALIRDYLDRLDERYL